MRNRILQSLPFHAFMAESLPPKRLRKKRNKKANSPLMHKTKKLLLVARRSFDTVEIVDQKKMVMPAKH